MSQIERSIRELVRQRRVVVSQHAAGRIARRQILFTAIVAGVPSGEVIEEYSKFHAGPALLMLQRDGENGAIHVVWGIEIGTTEPAVIVTAYRPDPGQWGNDFRKRKS